VTTVAFDGKVMAADRFWAAVPGTGGDKTAEIGPLIMGFCGDCQHMRKAFNAVAAAIFGDDVEYDMEDSEVLAYNVDTGELTHWCGNLSYIVIDAPTAIGSGAAYAVGAMAAGFSAMEAIGVAAKYDANTKLSFGCTAHEVEDDDDD